MTGKGLETGVGDRLVEDRHNREAVVGLAVELMVRVEVATRGEAVLTEGAAGVLLLTMVLRHQPTRSFGKLYTMFTKGTLSYGIAVTC